MKALIAKVIKKAGFEVRRYKPQWSDEARLKCLLELYNIDLVLDVGANIGQYAQTLRSIGYKGWIISFEPLSAAHAILLKRSTNDPRWEVAPRMAIGDTDGEVTIHISGNSLSSSILEMLSTHIKAAPGSQYVGQETTPVKTLDSLWGSIIPCDFKEVYLKLDVQGYEHRVIQGARKILKQARGIQTELSLVPLYDSQKLFNEMIEEMNQLGFHLHTIFPGFLDSETCRSLQIDGVFIR
ncbi:MAG: FkbM family methyltransferase [Acidiferrobacterales bacterium]